jgi:hypothetical protein
VLGHRHDDLPGEFQFIAHGKPDQAGRDEDLRVHGHCAAGRINQLVIRRESHGLGRLEYRDTFILPLEVDRHRDAAGMLNIGVGDELRRLCRREPEHPPDGTDVVQRPLDVIIPLRPGQVPGDHRQISGRAAVTRFTGESRRSISRPIPDHLSIKDTGNIPLPDWL